MTQLKDDITADFEAILTEWPNVRNKTKSKISTMKNYYSTTEDTFEVEQKTDRDRNDLKGDLDRHTDLASRGSNVKRDLVTQVESSENRVQKMIKYGRPAAVGFAVLGAVIGAGIGAKAPGWGQVAAIGVGGALGFIVFAVVALVLYFGLKWMFIRRRDMWKQVQSSNQEGMALVDLIKENKSCLSEIRNQLDDIEVDNMDSGRDALLEKMSEYMV